MIVDDHALFREGIMAILRRHDDITIVGEASDGHEAIQKVGDLRPDIILMDIAMPGLGGFEAATAIRKSMPHVRIIMISQYDDKEYVRRFLKVGVSGYVLKKAVGAELITAIRAVAKGETYLYPSIASSVIDTLSRDESMEEEDIVETLTPREMEVLKLIAEGKTHKEIATLLDISPKTAIAHQTHISEKLGIHSKAGLITFAIQKGIVKISL